MALALGDGTGPLTARALEAGSPAAGSPGSTPFAATGGIFTRGNGAAAPGWLLPGLRDPAHAVTLRRFRGRPVVVNFWASWCTPCRKEMPALEQVHRLLAGQVSFVGLDSQDERSAGLAFAHKSGASYPLVMANARVWSAYGVSALPSTFFISAKGKIVGKDFGGLTRRRLVQLLIKLFHVSPARQAANAREPGTRAGPASLAAAQQGPGCGGPADAMMVPRGFQGFGNRRRSVVTDPAGLAQEGMASVRNRPRPAGVPGSSLTASGPA